MIDQKDYLERLDRIAKVLSESGNIICLYDDEMEITLGLVLDEIERVKKNEKRN